MMLNMATHEYIEELKNMGRKKVDRSDKIIQTFETTKPLKTRLREHAKQQGVTVSAFIREILEKYFEERRN
jgi:predicted DNA-binding protein